MNAITVTFNVPDQQLEDILVTAFEGGCSYWLKQIKFTNKPTKKTEFASEHLTRTPDGKLTLILHEPISDESKILSYELTKEKLLIGIARCVTEGRITATYDGQTKGQLARTEDKLLNFAKDIPIYQLDHDAGGADCAVQYALFNELIFG